MSLGVFSSLQFFEELEKNWHEFLFKCLVEFTSKAIWSWAFLC